jgi:hypothetical protein
MPVYNSSLQKDPAQPGSDAAHWKRNAPEVAVWETGSGHAIVGRGEFITLLGSNWRGSVSGHTIFQSIIRG